MKCPSCEAEWQPGKSASVLAACPFCGASLAPQKKEAAADSGTIEGVLRSLVQERGVALYKKENASQLKALLSDLAVEFPRERKVLGVVLTEGVQERLLKADGGTDAEKHGAAAWCRLHLTEELCMTEHGATEAVNILAAGLGWEPPLEPTPAASAQPQGVPQQPQGAPQPAPAETEETASAAAVQRPAATHAQPQYAAVLGIDLENTTARVLCDGNPSHNPLEEKDIIFVGGKTDTETLRGMRRAAEKGLGRAVTGAVIRVPENAGLAQIHELVHSAKDAGFQNVRVLSGAVALALYCGEQLTYEGLLCVLSFYANCLGFAIVDSEDGVYEVRSVASRTVSRTVIGTPAMAAIAKELMAEASNAAYIQKSDMSRIRYIGGLDSCYKGNADNFGDEHVAQGLAIQGGIISGIIKNAMVLDVTRTDIGIETANGFEPIIERNTTVPTKKSRTIASSGQAITINVLEYDRNAKSVKAEDCTKLFSFTVNADENGTEIELTFAIDASCTLTVSAKDKATGKERAKLEY